ncbi:hypothetical protein GCM10029976_065920 [Kribbella albertanoniae]|nr:hypothetical protein [Kribbella albertanoniae]
MDGELRASRALRWRWWLDDVREVLRRHEQVVRLHLERTYRWGRG